MFQKFDDFLRRIFRREEDVIKMSVKFCRKHYFRKVNETLMNFRLRAENVEFVAKIRFDTIENGPSKVWLRTNLRHTHTHKHIPRVERTAVGTTRLPIAPRRCHAKHPLLAYAERLRACSAAMPQNRKQFKRRKFLKPLEFAFFVRCDASFSSFLKSSAQEQY